MGVLYCLPPLLPPVSVVLGDSLEAQYNRAVVLVGDALIATLLIERLIHEQLAEAIYEIGLDMRLDGFGSRSLSELDKMAKSASQQITAHLSRPNPGNDHQKKNDWMKHVRKAMRNVRKYVDKMTPGRARPWLEYLDSIEPWMKHWTGPPPMPPI